MKKFTNYTPGMRGIAMKDGSTHWIEAGATSEIDPKDIVGEVPDLGRAPAKDDGEEAALVDAVQAENADLKKQNAAQAKQITELTAENAKLKPAK